MVFLFQGINPAELLRLYIEYDLLEEAVAICVEYIDAVADTFKGQACDVFQLKVCNLNSVVALDDWLLGTDLWSFGLLSL